MKKLLCMLMLLAVGCVVSAQTTDTTFNTKNNILAQVKYTCEMHPEVVSNKPGKCPKCGMELTKVKTYTCQMHPEIVTNKPGKCPKCGMELTEVKTTENDKKGQ